MSNFGLTVGELEGLTVEQLKTFYKLMNGFQVMMWFERNRND